MSGWVEKLQNNMVKFRDEQPSDIQQQLTFIQQQYMLIGTITMVTKGKASLTGCSFSSIQKQ